MSLPALLNSTQALTTTDIAMLGVILFIGFIIGFLLSKILNKQQKLRFKAHIEDAANQQIAELTSLLDSTQESIAEYRVKLAKAEGKIERINELEDELAETQRSKTEVRLELAKSNATQQTIKVKFETENNALNDKIKLLEDSEERLKVQFENLANRIFEDRGEHLKNQNMAQLDGVLGPLKQQLEGFRRQIYESYSQEQSERATLKHQLDDLKKLNLQMSQDAINLTNALKGDNKQQGNWGEVILERVLQESGLRQGHEYDTQQDLKDSTGKRFKPDVIVHLPEEKDVVIDAKMSLVAYERYFHAQNDNEKAQALRDHLASIRAHIKGLSHKNYQQLYGLKSLDYVLMFIPLEPAFLLALEHEPKLINYALEHNIMLVSPTNLLVALRTINNIWRYEYQNQNAQQIAKQAGRIYDKLCGYIEDMEKLGRTLESAEKCYNSAMNKLSTGKGNLVRQAHQIQQLGAETTKQLNQPLLQQALDNDHIEQ